MPDDFEYAMLRRPTVHLVAGMQASFEESQQGHFTVFEPGFRPRHRDWLLDDYVADAVGSAAGPVRAAQILTRPLQGYPRPQLVVTPVSAPRTFLAVPFDFRQVQGQVTTVSLPPALPMVLVQEAVLRAAPMPGDARFPGPLESVTDAAGRQHFDARPPIDRYEWLVPQFQEPALGFSELGGVIGEISSTSTTTLMLPQARRNRARSTSPSPDPAAGREPPTLLGVTPSAAECSGARGSADPYPQAHVHARQRAGSYLEPKSFYPPVLTCPRRPHSEALQTAGHMHIVPAWAAAVTAPPRRCTCMIGRASCRCVASLPGCSLSHYVLFDVQGHARIRRAVADWTLTEIIADVLTVLPDTVSVRVLARIFAGTACGCSWWRVRGTLQPEMGVLPVDLRPTGGMICTLLVPGGATQQVVVRQVVDSCRTPPVDLLIARGGVFARLPLVADDALHSPPLQSWLGPVAHP